MVLPIGRLDAATAPEQREKLHDLVRAGDARLVVDLSETEFVDSSGLGALISGLKAARQTGGDLRITAPNRQVTAALEMTNLDRILTMNESADDILNG